ncbi:MAG: hypothetical protein ACOC5T_06210 [Elusimicrobiota bacterium]
MKIYLHDGKEKSMSEKKCEDCDHYEFCTIRIEYDIKPENCAGYIVSKEVKELEE